MNNVITKPFSFQIGQIVSAQLGNEGERSYRPECGVVVLAIRADSFGSPIYLVKPTDSEDFICTAVDVTNIPIKDEIKGQLYSTDGRFFGKGTKGEAFGLLTEEQARNSLGF